MYVHHIVNGFYSNGNREFKIVNAKMNWLYVLVDFTIGFDIIKHKRSSSDNYFKNIYFIEFFMHKNWANKIIPQSNKFCI